MNEQEKIILLYDNARNCRLPNGTWDIDKVRVVAHELGIKKQNGQPYPESSLRALLSKGKSIDEGLTPQRRTKRTKRIKKTATARKPRQSTMMNHIKQIVDSDLPSETKMKVIMDSLTINMQQ